MTNVKQTASPSGAPSAPASPRHPRGLPFPRPRLRRTLSSRLLVLVVSALAFAQAAFLLIGLARETRRWMLDQVQAAELAITALAGQGTPVSAVSQAKLLGLLQANCVQATGPGGQTMALCGDAGPPVPALRVDLPDETITRYLRLGLTAFLRETGPPLTVVGDGGAGTWHLEVSSPRRPLTRFLRAYARRYAVLMAAITLLTCTLLVASLQLMVVIPMRRIASSIGAFRRDPEGGTSLDTGHLAPLVSDEIALVGGQLAAMQDELRTTLWRYARLAAVGTAVAKMSHDLRGILSTAMLVADRLTMNKEQPVRDAGEVIVRAVHRATALAQQTLDFVRLGPPALTREKLALHQLVTEGAASATENTPRPAPIRPFTVRNDVPETMVADLDRDSMLRVLTNLIRNAAEARATQVTITGTGDGPSCILRVADNGTGLPLAVRTNLFKPFVTGGRGGGNGLGLSIARDLMRAHGGDLQLASTGAQGTEFILYAQQPKMDLE